MYATWRYKPEAAIGDTTSRSSFWHEKVPYERHCPYKTLNSLEDDGFRIAVHSRSVESANANTRALLERILWFAPKHFSVFASPGGGTLRSLAGDIETFTYEARPDSQFKNAYVAELKTEAVEKYSGFISRYHDQYHLQRLGLKEEGPRARTAAEDLLQLQAAKALKADIFISEDKWLLRKRQQVGQDVEIWILSVDETIDFIDTTLKGRGLFAYNHFAHATKSRYYDDRLKELIPEFEELWHQALTVGEDAEGYAISLHSRLRHLLETRDRIGHLYYSPASMSINEEMLYFLNFFFLLSAGSFDNLAWLCNFLFGLNLQEDFHAVGLREKRFRNALRARAARLVKCTKKYSQFLAVFEPARDSVAHRHLIWSMGFEEIGTNHGFCFAELTQDQIKPLSALMSIGTDESFRKWGLLRIDDVVLLEPYRFVNRSLRLLVEFMNEFFQTLLAEIAPDAVANRLPDRQEPDSDIYRFNLPFFREI